MRLLYYSIVLVLSLGICQCRAQAPKSVSMEMLIRDMIDLRRLTYFPDPPYTAKQFSSYDRATKSKDQGWFANGDRGHYLRVDKTAAGEEKVLLDADGPGVVTRIWSANANEGGTIRFYIDGNKEPAIKEKMEDLLRGQVKPFGSPIAGVRARGWNLYFPIPYQKHCKITIDGGSIYYQVNYRTYAKNVRVESFSMARINQLGSQIDRVKAILEGPDKEFKVEGTKEVKKYKIPAGGTVAIYQAAPGRSGSISELRIKISAKNVDKALRGCVLIGEFDNEKKPTVWCPVGDFFGAAPGINKYNSLPFTVKTDGVMMSRWEMPFRSGVRLKIMNTTTEDVTLGVYVMLTPYQWTKRSMYFHAKWKKDRIGTAKKSDWTYLNAKGSGLFVGDMLHVLNPVPTWWGEGDEKIFVDGEKFPSHFGTGTEDYYGYAWCSPEKFYSAYHNQTRCDGPGNKGNTSVNRFHILDDIPFTKSFKFDMEVWHWKQCIMVYAATSYWYALPGSTDTFTQPTQSKLTIDKL